MAHSAQYCGFRSKEPDTPVYFCIMTVADEMELFFAYRRLEMEGIKMHPFFEKDFDRGLTAIASSPIIDEEQRKLFDYPKWKIVDPSKERAK